VSTTTKIVLGGAAALALYYWWTHRTPCGCHDNPAAAGTGATAQQLSSLNGAAQGTTTVGPVLTAGLGAPMLGSTPSQVSQVGNGGAPVGTLGFLSSVRRSIAAVSAPKPAPPAPSSQIGEPTVLGGVGVQGTSPSGQPYIIGVS